MTSPLSILGNKIDLDQEWQSRIPYAVEIYRLYDEYKNNCNLDNEDSPLQFAAAVRQKIIEQGAERFGVVQLMVSRIGELYRSLFYRLCLKNLCVHSVEKESLLYKKLRRQLVRRIRHDPRRLVIDVFICGLWHNSTNSNFNQASFARDFGISSAQVTALLKQFWAKKGNINALTKSSSNSISPDKIQEGFARLGFVPQISFVEPIVENETSDTDIEKIEKMEYLYQPAAMTTRERRLIALINTAREIFACCPESDQKYDDIKRLLAFNLSTIYCTVDKSRLNHLTTEVYRLLRSSDFPCAESLVSSYLISDNFHNHDRVNGINALYQCSAVIHSRKKDVEGLVDENKSPLLRFDESNATQVTETAIADQMEKRSATASTVFATWERETETDKSTEDDVQTGDSESSDENTAFRLNNNFAKVYGE